MMVIPKPMTESDGCWQVDSFHRSLMLSPAAVPRRTILLIRTASGELWVMDDHEVQSFVEPGGVRILYAVDGAPAPAS
jgi:hypothetical protein